MTGKLKAVLLLFIMFGLGLAGGMAFQNFRFHRMGPPHPMFAERRIKRMVSQLKLTSAQEQAVRQIFQNAHERAMDINKKVSWELAQIHRDSVQAIEKVLTPDQQREFEKMHEKYHEHHRFLPDDAQPRPKPDDNS